MLRTPPERSGFLCAREVVPLWRSKELRHPLQVIQTLSTIMPSDVGDPLTSRDRARQPQSEGPRPPANGSLPPAARLEALRLNSSRYAGVVSGKPFFAKMSAKNRAGFVALALRETSCVLPGYS